MLKEIAEGYAPRVLVQGMASAVARRQLPFMRGHGTPIVAGVSRTQPGGEVDGVPIFADCAAAVAATGAEAALSFVPPEAVREAAEEAIEAGCRLLVTVAEGVPVHDAARIRRLARERGTTWVGACTPGLAAPGRLKMGFLPEVSLLPGRLGVMSKSGTLSYEVNYRLAQRGIGQSLWVGVGGDVVKGTRFADLVALFRDDPRTEALLVIGEIGGNEEEELAETLREAGFDRPVFVLLAGSQAPEGIAMGHAGAMVMGAAGTIASKRQALSAAGATVYDSIAAVVDAVVARFQPSPAQRGREGPA